MVNLSEKLALIMKQRRYNNRTLSLAAGFSPNYVRSIMTGHTPTVDKLQKIAEVLGCSVGFLLNEGKDHKEPSQVDIELLARAIREGDREIAKSIHIIDSKKKAAIYMTYYEDYLNDSPQQLRA